MWFCGAFMFAVLLLCEAVLLIKITLDVVLN